MDIKGFDNIEVSDRLDKTIANTIDKCKRHKKSMKFRKRMVRGTSVAAAVAISFTIGVNSSSTIAKAFDKVPVIGYLSKAVRFSYNESISKAIESGLTKDVNLNKEDKGIKLSIDKVLADDKNIYIMYSIDSKSNQGGLSKAMPDNITITDNKGAVIVDSQYRDTMVQPDFVGKKGDFLFPGANSYAKCNVSCFEKEGEDNKTYGMVQVATRDGQITPDEINISFLEFTEAYNHNYSKESYKEFVNKNGREARSINTNMSFNIKVDKNLNSVKPEVYKDIKFEADNVDLNIEHLKIYPTATELKIQLGKNKKTNKQALSILMPLGDHEEVIPYLIDEKGNKYMPNRRVAALEDGNYNTIVFESVYFNEPKELYLVVNQVSYEDRGMVKVDGVKVRIK